MLPTFLGIGVPRAGTTWLTDLLGSHPDVVMSQSRKEVHFFDHHFERGLGWYEGFFPSSGARPLAVGEYTPHYLYDPVVPGRVGSVESIQRFVISLRDPVERAVSHYRFRQQVDGWQGSFDEFLVAYPDAIDWGYYARHLAPWLDHFERERFLVLQFETAVGDPAATKEALASHLGIDPGGFPEGSGDVPRNERFTPRHPRLHRMARRGARRLRAVDGDWAVTLARRSGLVRAINRRGQPGQMGGVVSHDARRRLRQLYQPDGERLERLTGLTFDAWLPEGA